MVITRDMVADKIVQYLQHKIKLEALVDWAERVIMEEDLEDNYFDQINEVIMRLGLSDVQAFGLSIDDCEILLNKLGYTAKVNVELSLLE